MLLQLRPEIVLLEKKQRSDTKKAKKQVVDVQTLDGPWEAQSNLIESNLSQPNLTELKSDQSIYQSIIQEEQRDGLNDRDTYQNLIAHNIRITDLYEIARRHGSDEVDMVTEIYETICDMVCVPREKVVIKKTEYPWQVVKAQFLKLKHVHISNILNRIVDANLRIKNMNAYLVSTLYIESLNGTIVQQAELHDDYLQSLRGNPYSV